MKSKSLIMKINEAMADPDFRLAVMRGQKAIKIDILEAKTQAEKRTIYSVAKKQGFCVHIKNNTAFLYMEV